MAANIYHFISLEIFKIKGSRNEECLSIYVTTIPHGKCFALFPRSFLYINCTLGTTLAFCIRSGFKVCRMVEICIPNNCLFVVCRSFPIFWRENDVKRLTASFKFQLMM